MGKKIKVAMIAPPWLPIPPDGYGGIENVLACLVPELLKLGVEVELFATGDSKIKGVKKHWLYKTGQYEHIHKPLYDTLPVAIAHLQFAIDIIQKDKTFSVIHDHSVFIGPLLFYNLHPSPKPVIHTLHGPPFTTPDRLELDIPDNLPMWKQFKRPNGLHLVPISDAQGKLAPASLKAQLLTAVHNGVRPENFPFTEKKENYFITLGRVHPEKGQHLAIKACLELKQNLKMAGGVDDITSPRKLFLELANPLSKYRSDIAFKYFSDNVLPYLKPRQIEHLGEVKGKRKLNLITKAKGLLFPIQWNEPFGLAVIEALACGTPVIAMRRGSMPEIVEHGVNGFLAKNYSEFKKYMARIGDIDPKNCRSSVENKFSARAMAQNYLDHYKTVLKIN